MNGCLTAPGASMVFSYCNTFSLAAFGPLRQAIFNKKGGLSSETPLAAAHFNGLKK